MLKLICTTVVALGSLALFSDNASAQHFHALPYPQTHFHAIPHGNHLDLIPHTSRHRDLVPSYGSLYPSYYSRYRAGVGNYGDFSNRLGGFSSSYYDRVNRYAPLPPTTPFSGVQIRTPGFSIGFGGNAPYCGPRW